MVEEVLTRPPEITFLRQGIPPPSPLYIAREDYLGFEVANSVTAQTLLVRGRLLLATGVVVPFQKVLRPDADRLVDTFDLQLAEGFLLNVVIIHGPATLPGQTWTRATVLRGARPAEIEQAVLCQGYVSTGYWLSWPPGIYDRIADGPGALRSIAGTNPAAGVEITETVPTNVRWRLLLARFTLVTNATVATRRVRLFIDDGTNDLYVGEVEATQAASLTRNYNFAAGLGFQQTAFANSNLGVGIPPVVLREGYRIRTSTVNLQAGDDFAAPRLFVEEWIEF